MFSTYVADRFQSPNRPRRCPQSRESRPAGPTQQSITFTLKNLSAHGLMQIYVDHAIIPRLSPVRTKAGLLTKR